MCRRFALTSDLKGIVQSFSAPAPPSAWESVVPRYGIAPGAELVSDNPVIHLTLYQK
jgi:putative SOS response-associated peptidase YedK